MKRVDSYLTKTINNLTDKPQFKSLLKIHKNWNGIIIDKYQDFCYPNKIKINFNQKQALLEVVSNNPATTFYINNNKVYIVNRINMLFGYKAIENIFIVEIPKKIVKKHKNQFLKNKLHSTIDQEKINKITFREDINIELQNKIKDLYLNLLTYKE